MKTNFIKVRNQDGRLICIINYTGDHWQVFIKDHKCYTDLDLNQNGTYQVKNRILDDTPR